MAFSFKDCLKNAFIQAIGSNPDFEIILAAVKWVEKGVLVESDIEEIQNAINNQYIAKEEFMENSITEEFINDISSEENTTENSEVTE